MSFSKKKKNGKMSWQKMMTWTHDLVLSWHLMEKTLTEIDGRAFLTTK